MASKRPEGAAGDVEVHLRERVRPARQGGAELALQVGRGDGGGERSVGAEREARHAGEERSGDGHGDERVVEGERADGGEHGHCLPVEGRAVGGDDERERATAKVGREVREREHDAARALGDGDCLEVVEPGEGLKQVVPRDLVHEGQVEDQIPKVRRLQLRQDVYRPAPAIPQFENSQIRARGQRAGHTSIRSTNHVLHGPTAEKLEVLGPLHYVGERIGGVAGMAIDFPCCGLGQRQTLEHVLTRWDSEEVVAEFLDLFRSAIEDDGVERRVQGDSLSGFACM